MAELRIVCPGQPEQRIDLSGGEVTIGRSDDCGAWIAEKKASRVHLVIRALSTGGHVAEDQGSSNGTWFGDQRILRHLLSDGDVVRIGDTEIQFSAGPQALSSSPVTGSIVSGSPVSGTLELKAVDPVAPEPSPVAAASSGDDGSSASQVSERSSESVRAQGGRRDVGRIGARALAFVAVGVLAIIGVEAFLGGQAERAKQETLARTQALDILRDVSKLPHEDFKREVDAFRDRFPASPHLGTLEAHLRYTDERDQHRELVEGELRRLLDWPEGIEPSEMRWRLQALRDRLPNDESFGEKVQHAIGALDRRQGTLDAQAFDRLDHEVQLALGESRPARAQRLLAAFRYANPGLTSATLDRLGGLDKRAEQSAQTLFADAWRAAEDAKSPAAARRALGQAWPGLAGTAQGTRIQNRLRDLGRRPGAAPTAPDAVPANAGTPSRPGAGTPGGADRPTPPPGLADDILAKADQAQTLLLARSWATGRKALGELIEKVDPGRLKNEWAQLLADTDRILALTQALGERAQEDKQPKVKLATAGRVTVLEASGTRVKVQTKDGDKTWLWSQVADEDVIDLLTPPRPSAEQRVALALIAADLSDRERLFEILYPLFEKGKDTAEASRVIAYRVHGRATVPEGGYQAYKGEILDARGLERAKQAERVVDLRAGTEKLLAQVKKQKVFKKLAKLDAMRTELDQRRGYALLAIFNVKHYPYPADKNGKPYLAVQGEIDARVASVKEIWDDPYKVRISRKGAVGKMFEEWDALVAELQTYGEDVHELKKLIAPYQLYATDEPITIREYFRDEKEKTRFTYNRWVMNEYNPARTELASGAERQQVRVTNDYRTMMGFTASVSPGARDFESIDKTNVIEILDAGSLKKLVPLRAVRVDNRLIRAARDHSLDMARRGFFSHFAPPNPASGTGRTSPHERMATAGYSGYGSSENIANGATAPERAHWMWVHSSGHHRNILSNWSDLGSGQAGRLWTQNFGNGAGGRTRIAPDTDIHYPERRGR